MVKTKSKQSLNAGLTERSRYSVFILKFNIKLYILCKFDEFHNKNRGEPH